MTGPHAPGSENRDRPGRLAALLGAFAAGARETSLRMLTAFSAALLIGSLYGLAVSVVLDFPRPLPDRAMLGLLLGLWLAAPAVAWSLLRGGVRTLVRLGSRSARPSAPDAFGRHLAESLAVVAVWLGLAVTAGDAIVGAVFFQGERRQHPYRWLVADLALTAVAAVMVLWAARRVSRLPPRRLVAAGAGVVLLTLLVQLSWGALTTRARPTGSLPDAGSARSDTRFKVIVLGLDGASWNLLDEMMAAGEMPALARAIPRGVRADLVSEFPYQSPSVWMTVATGRAPREHGVLSYLTWDFPLCSLCPDHELRQKWRYPFHLFTASLAAVDLARLAPVTGSSLRAVPIWYQVCRQGASVTVLNWWCSYPPDPAPNARVVSDAWFKEWMWMEFPVECDRPLVQPTELEARIAPFRRDPEQVGLEVLAGYGDFDAQDHEKLRLTLKKRVGEGTFSVEEVARLRLAHLRWGTAVEENVFNVAFELCRRDPSDLTLAVSGFQDKVNHLFVPYHWPDRFDGVDPDEVRRYGGIVRAHHRRLDRWLGRFFELADERTVVLVISDHGLVVRRDNPLTPESHGLEGVLVAVGGPVRVGRSGLRPSIYDLAPTLYYLLGLPVPAGLSGRVLTDLFEDAFVAGHPPRMGPAGAGK